MKKRNLKKLLILNLPYVLIGLYATKLGEAWRLSRRHGRIPEIPPPDGRLHRRLSVSASQLSSFDLLIGLVIGWVLRLLVYQEAGMQRSIGGMNGNTAPPAGVRTADIAPFMDPDPENNVILTKTERLTMSSRPKDPATPGTRMCWSSAAPVPVKPGFSSSPISCSAPKRKELRSWSPTRRGRIW